MSILFLSSIYQVHAQEQREQGGTNLKEYYIRGVYWPWERNNAVAKKSSQELWQFVDNTMKMLKDFNCNLVWVVNISMEDAAKVCDIAKKYGIKVAPNINPFLGLTYNGFTSAEDIKDAAQETVNILGGKSALGAYVLRDEPRRLQTKQMELFRRALKKSDSTRDAIVVTMNTQTDSYAHQTGFPILCTDIYPFGGDRSPDIPNPASASQGYYRNLLSALAGEAHKAGKWMWVMPQVYGEFWGPWWYDENKQVVIEPGVYHLWRMPTIEETHWQIWEGLRNGCKGVVFFVLLPLANDWDGKSTVPAGMAQVAAKQKPIVNKQVRTEKGAALLYIDGTVTPQMVEMGKTFATLSKIENLLLSLETADFPVSFAEEPFSMATFSSPLSPSSRYVVVVNDNLKESEKEQIFFLPHTRQVEDIITGKTLPLRENASDNMLSASLELEPGSGTVLKVEFAENEPGFILFEEDFSIVTMGVQTKNISRQSVRRGFGAGWEWVARKEAGLPPDAKGVLTIGDISKPGGATGGVLTSPGTRLDVYMHIEGNFKAAESVIVEWVADDGKRGWLRSNNYHLPILIPQGIKEVEIQPADGISVSRILLWAIPKHK